MKRKAMISRTGAAFMAASMCMSMGMPVMAAGANYVGTIGGTKTTTFDKYLVMDQDTEVPNVVFAYAITAGTAKTYDVEGKKFEILAGVDPELVVMNGVGTAEAHQIAFSHEDDTLQDENEYVKNYDSVTEKYAKKTATLDFSGCRFTEPGVYRYIITESGTNQGVTNDADPTRVVDVYVVDESTDTEKKLSISGYVLHANEDELSTTDRYGTNGADPATKSQGFTNEYATTDLTVRGEVTGNQASRDKYFEFTVNLTDATPGTVYSVDITKADAVTGSNAATLDEYEGKANPTTLTVGADGTATEKFYLQHGQEIKICGLAENTRYEVTENSEDYKPSPASVEGYTAPVTGTIANDSVKTSYKNARDGIIPTGVVMTVAPFAAVTLLGGIGTVTMVMKKKK